MTVWKCGRATVESPAKHGDNDYLSKLGRVKPTLGETLLIIGGKLLAEDRYNGRHQHGRQLYLGYIRKVAQAIDMDEVQAIAEDSQQADGTGLPGFRRCSRGGQNDCVAVCQDS